MSIRFMIIDGQEEFRSLLTHHISTHWQDAIISEYDPVASGYLPDEFSGADNDIILLGNQLGERDGVEIVRSFLKQSNFPALIYFGSRPEEGPILDRGVAGFFLRDAFSHHELIIRLTDVIIARRRLSSTGPRSRRCSCPSASFR